MTPEEKLTSLGFELKKQTPFHPAVAVGKISGNLLSVNHGTLYPVLLKLEQEGSISSCWGVSDNNRKARFYSITRAGRKALQSEKHQWRQATEIMARFFALDGEAE